VAGPRLGRVSPAASDLTPLPLALSFFFWLALRRRAWARLSALATFNHKIGFHQNFLSGFSDLLSLRFN
jgi:hypothetical protein